MLSLREMSPVSHIPAGTTTRPPPCLSNALMALRNASVLRVTPSPTPPKSLIFTLLSGIVGTTGCDMLTGRLE